MKGVVKKVHSKLFLGGGVFLFFGLLCVVFFKPWLRFQTSKPAPASCSTTTTPPVVFLFPHQDDEMFMAGTIHRALTGGRPVYAIMVTDGANSRARHMINGENDDHTAVRDGLKHYRHIPLREGYLPLDKHAFAVARNKEFFESMLTLGLQPEHILFANSGGVEGTTTPEYPNDSLTVASATEVIRSFCNLLGNGTYITVAAELGNLNATHGDHYALREALRHYPGSMEKKFFSEKIGVGSPVPLSQEEMVTKKKALRAYGVWNPREGRFAIGEHSVVDLLAAWKRSPVEYELDASELP